MNVIAKFELQGRSNAIKNNWNMWGLQSPLPHPQVIWSQSDFRHMDDTAADALHYP